MNDDEDGDQSSYDSTTHGGSDAHPSEAKQPEVIAQKEDKAVFWIRLVVIMVLVGSTVAVACLVYTFLSTQEQTSFAEQFESDSDKVMESVASNLDLSLSAVDAFAAGLVSYVKATNQTFPFITYPDFGVRAAKLRQISKAMEVGIFPLITDETRPKWEQNWTLDHDEWLQETYEIQKTDPTFLGPPVTNWTTNPVIHGLFGPREANQGIYLPKWMASPITNSFFPFYNFDLYSDISQRGGIQHVLDTKRTMVAPALNLLDTSDPVQAEYAQATVRWATGFIGDSEDPSEPLAGYYYPLLEDATHSVSIDNYQNSTIHGLVIVGLWFRDLLRNILPDGSDGIVVVFSNCNQMFTYRIDGPQTVYLGRGDHHETMYDSYAKSSSYKNLHKFSTGARTYSGVPFDNEYCPYNVAVYPSTMMQDNHTTNNPIIFTIVAVSIFLFTSLVFMVYDKLVEVRQKVVMKTAVRSTAIVSSLYPSNVRDRLFQPDAQEKEQAKKKKSGNDFQVGYNKADMLGTISADPSTSTTLNRNTPPIADLYPEVSTVRRRCSCLEQY